MTSKFLTDFTTALTTIHTEAEIEQAVTDKVLAAQATAIAPLQQSIADAQTGISEVQQALLDLGKKLASGDTTGAQTALDTATASLTTAATATTDAGNTAGAPVAADDKGDAA